MIRCFSIRWTSKCTPIDKVAIWRSSPKPPWPYWTRLGTSLSITQPWSPSSSWTSPQWIQAWNHWIQKSKYLTHLLQDQSTVRYRPFQLGSWTPWHDPSTIEAKFSPILQCMGINHILNCCNILWAKQRLLALRTCYPTWTKACFAHSQTRFEGILEARLSWWGLLLFWVRKCWQVANPIVYSTSLFLDWHQPWPEQPLKVTWICCIQFQNIPQHFPTILQTP